jgi:hypothetical protein
VFDLPTRYSRHPIPSTPEGVHDKVGLLKNSSLHCDVGLWAVPSPSSEDADLMLAQGCWGFA